MTVHRVDDTTFIIDDAVELSFDVILNRWTFSKLPERVEISQLFKTMEGAIDAYKDGNIRWEIV